MCICTHFISFLWPVAAQPPARRRHRGQGLSPLQAAQMYICAMLARTFSFSRGLVFLLYSPASFSRTLSGYADRFCGFQQKRSAPVFLQCTSHCIILEQFAIDFSGKDRLSRQIAIRSLGRRTGQGNKISIQPVSLSFPAQSISKSGEKIHSQEQQQSQCGGAVKNARFCCHLTAESPKSDTTFKDAHFSSETVTAFLGDSDATRCQIPRILTAPLRDEGIGLRKGQLFPFSEAFPAHPREAYPIRWCLVGSGTILFAKRTPLCFVKLWFSDPT